MGYSFPTFRLSACIKCLGGWSVVIHHNSQHPSLSLSTVYQSPVTCALAPVFSLANPKTPFMVQTSTPNMQRAHRSPPAPTLLNPQWLGPARLGSISYDSTPVLANPSYAAGGVVGGACSAAAVDDCTYDGVPNLSCLYWRSITALSRLSF